MMIRFVMFLLVFLPFSTKVEAGFWDNLRGMVWKQQTKTLPTIDVLIVNDRVRVDLEVKGPYQVFDPNTRQYIGKRNLGKRKPFEAIPAGLKWGEEFPGIFQLEIIPEDQSVTTIVDGIEYKGILLIYDIGGSISIVNRVPIEEYLSSILPQHFREPLREEALAAIAISARTNAFYLSKNPKNKYWAVDADNVNYQGQVSALPSSEMSHAIQATRHMVLSYTGAYEGTVTPFQTRWKADESQPQLSGVSRITIQDVEEMAKQGLHAAQILSNAYPGSHIELIY